MPAAPAASVALGAVCGMQSNSGHCSEFHVAGLGKFRSAPAYSGSLGPLISFVQVAPAAACGAARATRVGTSKASPVTRATNARDPPLLQSPVMGGAIPARVRIQTILPRRVEFP